MSNNEPQHTACFRLIKGSCLDQNVDVIVNAANKMLLAGGGVCGAIFSKAGMQELTEACSKIPTPLKDGDAVMTPAFNITNAKAIIHAVGPNFAMTPDAFEELYNAYYNSILLVKEHGYHSIAFPLISSGIFGGWLENPAVESYKQAKRAFDAAAADYDLEMYLCAFTDDEYDKCEKYSKQ